MLSRHSTNNRLPRLGLWMLLLAGCATPAARSWLDPRTAVTVTAQPQTLVLAHEDFPAGVNVRDYAELGVLQINRSGTRTPYLARVSWSTVDRDAEVLRRQDAALSCMTLWLNDQPLALRQATTEVPLSITPFRLPSPNARIAYYPLSAAALAALAAAQSIAMQPGCNVAMSAVDADYRVWRGSMRSVTAFIAALAP